MIIIIKPDLILIFRSITLFKNLNLSEILRLYERPAKGHSFKSKQWVNFRLI